MAPAIAHDHKYFFFSLVTALSLACYHGRVSQLPINAVTVQVNPGEIDMSRLTGTWLTRTWLHSSWRVAFGSVELPCWIGRLTDYWRGPMESKIIFDVSAKAFPWQFIWASVASLVVGGLLVFLKNLKFRLFSQIVGYFMIGSAFICAAYNSINWHVARSHQMKALASGDYQAVEGTVENFRPRPNDGSSNESFTISGHTFSYSELEHL